MAGVAGCHGEMCLSATMLSTAANSPFMNSSGSSRHPPTHESTSGVQNFSAGRRTRFTTAAPHLLSGLARNHRRRSQEIRLMRVCARDGMPKNRFWLIWLRIDSCRPFNLRLLCQPRGGTIPDRVEGRRRLGLRRDVAAL